jgi:hypothetical protein
MRGIGTYRKIFPAHFPPFPALGDELLGVWAPDVLSVMHHVDAILDLCALRDEDLGFPIWSAATGESGIFVSGPGIGCYNGIDAEGFVHAVLEVCAAL